MKGIILAGGTASRLFPATLAVSKQMLPVYDKPMIYYPISTLMLSNIREILIISTPNDIEAFKRLLGDGSRFGLKFSYKIQDRPRGLADAFIIGEEFIGKENVVLVLGDNIFYGTGFSKILKKASSRIIGGTIFAYPVKNPCAYGVVEFGNDNKAISIEEKPKNPKSCYAVPGLYFYDNNVIEIAKTVKPSKRGEIEITAINNAYLANGSLNVEILGRGFAWLDTGNPGDLLAASSFIEAIQKRQGLYVACLEEIAFKKNWITKKSLLESASKMQKTEYGQYLNDLAKEEKTLSLPTD